MTIGAMKMIPGFQKEMEIKRSIEMIQTTALLISRTQHPIKERITRCGFLWNLGKECLSR